MDAAAPEVTPSMLLASILRLQRVGQRVEHAHRAQ